MGRSPKSVGKRHESANATIVYYDASELPLPTTHWFLPSPDGAGMVKVPRHIHHASQFMADTHGFIQVEVPPCNEWLTQKIVREYAVQLFGTGDKSYPSYKDGKPHNEAAYWVLQRHIEKRNFIWGDTPAFNSGAWFAEMNAKTAILEMLRYQDDFTELQRQMEAAFGKQNLIDIPSEREVLRDLYELIDECRGRGSMREVVELHRLIIEMRGWIKRCLHCGEELRCSDDLN